jgi:hypothetical protein
MTGIDLHRLALRLKVIEVLQALAHRRLLAEEARRHWRRLILPN